jgi:Tfp pilus assembly PilM family ATPase
MTAMGTVVQQLAEEIQRCRRYHEATFPGVLIDKLVFTGGGASQRKVCQTVAQRLHIAAKIGDPIRRLTGEIDHPRPDFVSAGIDRRRSQPGWVVACGLSLGGM